MILQNSSNLHNRTIPSDVNDILDREKLPILLSPEEQAAGKGTNWHELEINCGVRNLSPLIFKWTHLTALYLNDNRIQVLPACIARLWNLKKLDLTNNKIRSLPIEIGELTQLREFSLNHNQLRQLPYELGKLFNIYKLGLKGNPLHQDILNLYNEPNGTRKLLEYMLDNLHVNFTQAPLRPWHTLNSYDGTTPTAKFTLMCYNVLCERYATRQMYGYCPNWALNWEYRKKVILDEITMYGADLITLQEVEFDQFMTFFQPELARIGYEGLFRPKTRAKTMNENERKRVDGCAIFFKASKFQLVKEHVIEFSPLAMAQGANKGSEVMINRVMTKDNIALAALLETKESVYENASNEFVKQNILLATCHIHWDPEFCDVKLIQTMILVDQLKKILEEHPTSNVQLLLCGDFNSLPESGVIEYIENGEISKNHKDFKNIEYNKSLCQMMSHRSDEDMYNHNFRLRSAIKQDIMPYTNYTYEFKGMIDYIFYPSQTMKPTGFLGPVDSQWLKENKVVGCPHPQVPSDHFSLLVELVMPLHLGNFSAITTSNAQYPHYPNMLIPPQHQPPLAPTLMAEPPGGGGPGGAQTLAQQPMPPNMYQPISQNNPIMNNFVNYPPAHTQPPPGMNNGVLR